MAGFFDRLLGFGGNDDQLAPQINGFNPQAGVGVGGFNPLQQQFQPYQPPQRDRFQTGLGDSLLAIGSFLSTRNPAVGAQLLEQRRANRFDQDRFAAQEARQNQAFNYQLQKDQREAQAAQQRSRAVEDAIKTLPPEQQAIARANPDAFLDAFTKNQFETPEYRNVTFRRGNQEIFGLLDPKTGQIRELSQGAAFAPQQQTPYSDVGKINADIKRGVITPEQGAQAIAALNSSSGGNQVKGEGDLRNEFRNLTKDYSQSLAGFQKVQQAAQGGTGADDVALIFGYLKTLDPASTVREGEVASVQNAGGAEDRVRNLYNGVLNGQKLTPDQRQQIVDAASRQFAAYQNSYDANKQYYTDLATRYRYNPQNIIIDYNSGGNNPNQNNQGQNNSNLIDADQLKSLGFE